MTATARTWLVPAALVALGLVPAVAGAVRLGGLAAGAPVTAESARFAASPLPVVLHVAGATPYCLLGALQLSSAFRRRWPAWHRRAGRVLAALGLLAALTGMWMAARYPIPAPMQGPLLRGVRMLVGSGMAISIALGVAAILRRDVAGHEAWMLRAYALGQGAGTQVLVLGPGLLLFGEVQGLTRDLLMTLAWAVNLAVAEAVIRRARGQGRGAGLATPAPRPG